MCKFFDLQRFIQLFTMVTCNKIARITFASLNKQMEIELAKRFFYCHWHYFVLYFDCNCSTPFRCGEFVFCNCIFQVLTLPAHVFWPKTRNYSESKWFCFFGQIYSHSESWDFSRVAVDLCPDLNTSVQGEDTISMCLAKGAPFHSYDQTIWYYARFKSELDFTTQ